MPKVSGNAYVSGFGKWMKRRRETIGMSREALANKIGTKYEAIRLYEEGQRVMKIDRLFVLLRELGAPAAHLTPETFFEMLEMSPEALHLAEKLLTLDASGTSGKRLLRQIYALIAMEKSDRENFS